MAILLQENKIVIKKTNKVLFIGGGKTIYELAKWCKENSIDCGVLTSERQSLETINEKTFCEILQEIHVKFCVTDSISSRPAEIFISDYVCVFRYHYNE